jgi:hypothetical protein
MLKLFILWTLILNFDIPKGEIVKVGVSSYAFRWAVKARVLDVFGLLEKSAALGAEVVQILDQFRARC